MKKYRYIRILGRGVNGNVCLVEDQSFKLYATKCFAKNEKEYTHEVNILNALASPGSPYVAQLLLTFDTNCLSHILLEAMDSTLKAYMAVKRMKHDEVESAFVQVIRGLKYCHDLKIYHRDVKPDNVLINGNGDVKLCDFSLSCKVVQNENLTDYVVTLWYRAPELLFGCTWYNYSIDIWAACCTLIEMIHGTLPFLPVENTELSQIKAIILKIGKPTKDQMSKMNKTLVDIEGFAESSERFYSHIPFVNRTFVYDMQKRPTCDDILSELATMIDIDKKVPFDVHPTTRVELDSTPPAGWEMFDEKNF